MLYPEGGEEYADGKYVSLYLCLDKSVPEKCVYADFKLSIINQKNNNEYRTKRG